MDEPGKVANHLKPMDLNITILPLVTKGLSLPSLPGSRLTNFYRNASSALLQVVNQWLNFTYSGSHAFRSSNYCYLQERR